MVRHPAVNRTRATSLAVRIRPSQPDACAVHGQRCKALPLRVHSSFPRGVPSRQPGFDSDRNMAVDISLNYHINRPSTASGSADPAPEPTFRDPPHRQPGRDRDHLHDKAGLRQPTLMVHVVCTRVPRRIPARHQSPHAGFSSNVVVQLTLTPLLEPRPDLRPGFFAFRHLSQRQSRSTQPSPLHGGGVSGLLAHRKSATFARIEQTGRSAVRTRRGPPSLPQGRTAS